MIWENAVTEHVLLLLLFVTRVANLGGSDDDDEIFVPLPLGHPRSANMDSGADVQKESWSQLVDVLDAFVKTSEGDDRAPSEIVPDVQIEATVAPTDMLIRN